MNTSLILSVLRQRLRLQTRERCSRTELAAFQARSVARLREHAYAHSPFYKEFHAGQYDAALSELPVLTKSLLMERYDDVLTDPSVTRS